MDIYNLLYTVATTPRSGFYTGTSGILVQRGFMIIMANIIIYLHIYCFLNKSVGRKEND